MSFRLLAQTRAAMAAHVEQRADLSGCVARDDHALGGDPADEVVAGLGNLIGASRADPPREIEALELRAIEIRIRVEPARQRRVAHRPVSGSFRKRMSGVATRNVSTIAG